MGLENAIFQQQRWQLFTWTSPDGQYWNQIDNILYSWRLRSSIQSGKRIIGVNCGSDHELLIAKSRLKLKKVGKTTRPFRYDLNQIIYDYTVEVTNRFNGFILVNRVPEEPWMEIHNTTGGSDENHSQEKEIQEDKIVVWGGFTNSWEKNRNERQRRKGTAYPSECRVPQKNKDR